MLRVFYYYFITDFFYYRAWIFLNNFDFLTIEHGIFYTAWIHFRVELIPPKTSRRCYPSRPRPSLHALCLCSVGCARAWEMDQFAVLVLSWELSSLGGGGEGEKLIFIFCQENL